MKRLLKNSIFIILLISFSTVTCFRNIIWKNSLALWEDVVKKSPKKEKGHNNFGNAYNMQERYDEAINEYLEALELKPDYTDAHNNLGGAYHMQGRLNEAIEEYLIVLKLNPNYAAARYNLDVAYKMKELKDARWKLKAIDMVTD